MLPVFTLQRVSGQPQLVDDVTRDVGLHQLPFLGVVLCSLQQMVKLFWIELLREKRTVAKSRTDSFRSQEASIGLVPSLYLLTNDFKSDKVDLKKVLRLQEVMQEHRC